MSLRLEAAECLEPAAVHTVQLEGDLDVGLARCRTRRVHHLVDQAERAVVDESIAGSGNDLDAAKGIRVTGLLHRGIGFRECHDVFGDDDVAQAEYRGGRGQPQPLGDDDHLRPRPRRRRRVDPAHEQVVVSRSGRDAAQQAHVAGRAGLQLGASVEILEWEERRALLVGLLEHGLAAGRFIFAHACLALTPQLAQAQRGGGIGRDVADRRGRAPDRHLAGVHRGGAGRPHRQRIAAPSLQPFQDRRSLGDDTRGRGRITARRQTRVENHRAPRRRHARHVGPQRDVVGAVGRSQHVRNPRGARDGRIGRVKGGAVDGRDHGFESGALGLVELRFRRLRANRHRAGDADTQCGYGGGESLAHVHGGT